MAKLRKGVSYRFLERPNTRKSKYRIKNFVRATPSLVISKFDMGDLDLKKKFEYCLVLKPKVSLQIRQNALESARKSSNGLLEKEAGKNFRFKLRLYPHHILRENPMASGAGADRMSMGMAQSFGKPIGRSAQVMAGQAIFELWVDKPNLDLAKKALKRCQNKLPCTCTIEVAKIN